MSLLQARQSVNQNQLTSINIHGSGGCMNDRHHRHSIRLKGFDYSADGAYFVTICSQNRECLFGDVVDVEIQTSDIGRIVEYWWNEIPKHFRYVEIDEFCVMPNHFHGILWIVGAGLPRPGAETAPLPKLGQIIAYFKYQSTKQANVVLKNPGIKLWQRNYYERIIRNDDELSAVQKYISENPTKWETDPEYKPQTHLLRAAA